MRRFVVAASLVVALLVSFVQSPANSAERVIKIAFQGPLTGPEAELGLGQLQAVQYMATKFNQRNKGTLKVEVIEVDDQGDPFIAVKLAPLIAEDLSIIALVGPSYSGSTRASLPFYKEKLLPLISPSATNPFLTDPTNPFFGGPVFHRVVQISAKEAVALAGLAELGITNPRTFLVSDDQSWPEFEKSFRDADSSLVGSVVAKSSSSDYSFIVQEIIGRKATAVVLLGYSSSTSKIVTQLRNGGYKNRIVLSDASADPLFGSLVGSNLSEGVVATSTFGAPTSLPKEIQFDYKNTVGNSIPSYGVPALEATKIYLDCISKGSFTRSKILKCVDTYSGKNLMGESISFDTNGDIVGAPFPQLIMKNGVWVGLKNDDLKLTSTSSSTQPVTPTVLSFSFISKKIEIEIDLSKGATPDSVYIQLPGVSTKKIYAIIKGKTAKLSIPLTSSMFGKALSFRIVSVLKSIESKPYLSSIDIPTQQSGADIVATKVPSAPKNLFYTRTEKGHGITVEVDANKNTRSTDTYLYSTDLGISKSDAVKGLTIGSKSSFQVEIPSGLIGKKILVSVYSKNAIGDSQILPTTITPQSLETSAGSNSAACQKGSQIRTFESLKCPPGWFKR
jgi:branched-chain amino acid transport system substrate-binding protein